MQSGTERTVCGGFRLASYSLPWPLLALDICYPYLTLTRCNRAAISSYRPVERKKNQLKCTDAALLTTSGERIQHGGKSDGWVVIQDFTDRQLTELRRPMEPPFFSLSAARPYCRARGMGYSGLDKTF